MKKEEIAEKTKYEKASQSRAEDERRSPGDKQKMIRRYSDKMMRWIGNKKV